jgi:hypothetical protein
VPKEGRCELFLEFINKVICAGDEEATNWLLDYSAHLFQRPWEPPEVAILLRGRQGVGKSMFVESLGEILGNYFLAITQTKHLVGCFNVHLQDKLLVFAEEASFAGDRSYAGILKTLITQTTMAVEPKGVNVFAAKKYFRLFMASNENWMVPVDIDDRRYFVLDVSPVRQNDHAYFEALKEEWTNGGREAFYFVMLNRDISKFNYRRRPETPALHEQKLHSLRGAAARIYEMLETGWAPILSFERDRVFVSTRGLRRVAGNWENDYTERALAVELTKIAIGRTSVRLTTERQQIRGFWLPSLKEAREQWEKANNLRVKWLDPEATWKAFDRKNYENCPF